jgi:staphylococcal nuclease domain-containing protein 1
LQDSAAIAATLAPVPTSDDFNAMSFFNSIGKGKPVAGIVEAVLNGSTLRLSLLPDRMPVTVAVAGVQCPSMGKRPASAPAAPAAAEPAAESNGAAAAAAAAAENGNGAAAPAAGVVTAASIAAAGGHWVWSIAVTHSSYRSCSPARSINTISICCSFWCCSVLHTSK